MYRFNSLRYKRRVIANRVKTRFKRVVKRVSKTKAKNEFFSWLRGCFNKVGVNSPF